MINFEDITPTDLPQKVRSLRDAGYRLVQISATSLPEYLELYYSFDLAGTLLNLRLHIPHDDARVPSISSIYWAAFIYENELHDLFNLQVSDMVVDFQGNFYTTAVKFPFATPKPADTSTHSTGAPNGSPVTPAVAPNN